MLTRSSATSTLRKHFAIDIVVVETGRVSFEPQAAQPRRNVHPINPPSARSGKHLIDDDRPLPF